MSRSVRIYLVWVALAVLAGIIFLQRSREDGAYVPSSEQRRMFAFREPELGQIDLFYHGRLATLMRSPGGLWFLHDSSHSHSSIAAPGSAEPAAPGQPTAAAPPSPVGAPANGPGPTPATPPAQAHTEPDPAKAAKLAESVDFLARLIFDRRIQPTEPMKEYGLENPAALILFYGRSQNGKPAAAPLTSLYIGDTITNGFAYYAQVPGDRDITLIPLYQVDQLVQAAFGIDPHPNMNKGVPGERKN